MGTTLLGLIKKAGAFLMLGLLVPGGTLMILTLLLVGGLVPLPKKVAALVPVLRRFPGFVQRDSGRVRR